MSQWGWIVGVMVGVSVSLPLAAGQETDAGAGTNTPPRVSMQFQDANLKDVLKTFSQQTGINVVASEELGERRVTLYLEDVTVLDALDQILEASGLEYVRPVGSDIYIVKPKPKPDSTVPTLTKIYHLKFARVSTSRLAKAVKALGSKTLFEAQQLTQATSGFSTGGSSSTQTQEADAKDVGIDKVIEQLLTEHGKVVVDERTNSLLVTDVPANFPRIEGTLAALDVKTAQVLIETEVLETTLNKLKDLGVEWGTGTKGTMLTITPAQHATKFPFSFNGDKQEFVAPRSSSLPSFTRGGQLSLGSIDASQLNIALQALEQDSNTKILARPKVLTLDNESAVIRLTSQQAVAIQSISTTETGNLLAQTPERMTTGVVLVVTPQVNDGGYITMMVEPSVTKTVISEVSTSIVDPKTRSARSLVRMRQGETLVLGGLIDRTEKDSLQAVPVLSDIPILGAAFRNKETKNASTEVIVFVTPRIVGEGTSYALGSTGTEAPLLQAREQEQNPSKQQLMEEALARAEGRQL